MKKNIALIGMPGCSKTTTGKILAKMTGMVFCDIDELYESAYNEKIYETFEKHGEEVFRNRESALLWEACQKEPAIIATGGGIVLRENNIALLKEYCFVVELYAPTETIYNRIKNSVHRPLLKKMDAETIRRLYEARKDLYAAAAERRIDTDKLSPAQTAESICRIIQSLKE